MNTAALIQSLIENPSQHSRDSSFYKTHEQELLNILENSDLNNGKSGHESFEPFGDLHFPSVSYTHLTLPTNREV